MPRAPRIEFAGAIYHVMNRGDRMEKIFLDDQDREIFLKTLGETCESCGWDVHSYVLMGNHYHLLIETHRPTLVKGMQYLNSTYTRRYNVRHKTYGHVFQGRYKALLVDPEEERYFLTVSDYIHLNPVRSGLVKEVNEIWQYKWSSALWFGGRLKKHSEWLRWEKVYGQLGLGKWRSTTRRKFRSYLQRRILEEEDEGRLKKIRRGWCIGEKTFVEEMKERLLELSKKPKRDQENWNDLAVEEMEEEKAKRMLNAGVKVLGGKEEVLKGWKRLIIARWVRTHCKVSVVWLSSELGMKTRGGMANGIYLAGKSILKNHEHTLIWTKLTKVKI
jgi:putative transposase